VKVRDQISFCSLEDLDPAIAFTATRVNRLTSSGTADRIFIRKDYACGGAASRLHAPQANFGDTDFCQAISYR
jgi:hypothetical protein